VDTSNRQQPAIADVVAGMRVVDRAGQDVGVVMLVRMGDPQAVATDRQGTAEGTPDLVAGLDSQAEPDLANPFTDRMLRTGYVKIECSEFFAGNAYAPGDEVVAVHDDTVRLSSARESLVKES
jgi:hypothetical protein